MESEMRNSWTLVVGARRSACAVLELPISGAPGVAAFTSYDKMHPMITTPKHRSRLTSPRSRSRLGRVNSSSILEVRQLTKSYPSGGGSLTVVRDISFAIEAGSSCAIVGPSGSGRPPCSGFAPGSTSRLRARSGSRASISAALDEDGRARVRNESVGFVFQNFSSSRRSPRWRT